MLNTSVLFSKSISVLIAPVEVNMIVWYLKSLFVPSVHKSTRHFGLSFAYDAPKIWNDLPDDVRSNSSVNTFRKKLKAYLLSKVYPS